MGKRRYVLDTRILTVFFFVAMPFVAFGSFVVVSMARSAQQEAIGRNLEQRAAETRVWLERYVSDQIVHLRLLAMDPEIRETLARSAHRPPQLDDAKLREAAVNSDLAERLRDLVQVRPALKLLQVVDASGRVVASSSRGGRMVHADSAWFQALSRDFPEPRPHLTDIYRPPGASLAVFDLAYPVYDRQEGLWLGAVIAYLDASDLYSVLAPVRIGQTGHADLIRSTDGMVLAADESNWALTTVFPGFQYLQAAKLEAAVPSSRFFGRSFWVMPEIRNRQDGSLAEPARLVAYSAVEQVPDVNWLVVVEQDLAEATEPIRGVTRYLWIHFIGAFGTVILLALYFSFKLEHPVIEESLHLHEEHRPAGMAPDAEE